MDTPDEPQLTPLEREERPRDDLARENEERRLCRRADLDHIEALLTATEAQIQALRASQRQQEIWERGEDGFDGY